MTPSHTYRYPGVKPFTQDEKAIFFGRETEVKGLTRYILQEQVVVLYARSGLGKSSLINAGVIPELGQITDYRPLTMRFGAWQPPSNDSCTALTRARLDIPKGECYLDKILPGEHSFWRDFKRYQALRPEHNNFVIFFDQFEELFTYPDKEVEDFHAQLAEVINSEIPQRYRDAIEAEPELLDPEDLQLLYRPLDIKVVIAIRSDRLSQLDRLSGKLPAILNKRYQLTALSHQQAEDAILNPAYSDANGFVSSQFDYSDESLDQILDHLSQNGTAEIESFQLQVICQYAERQAMRKGLKLIEPEDLGDLSQIFRSYYDMQIAEIGAEADRLASRKLIEEGLIFEDAERRLALFEGQIERDYGVSPKLLAQLVDTHLLRAEPDPRGGFVYELSHDTLVEPVLQAKQKRLAKEKEQERAAEAEAERQRQAEAMELHRRELEEERKKRNRARWIAIGGVSLAIISLAALFYAISMTAEADRAKAQAQAQVHVSQAHLIYAEGKNNNFALLHLDSAAMFFPDKEPALFAYIQGMNAPQVEEGRRIYYLQHALSLECVAGIDTLTAISQSNFTRFWQQGKYGLAAEMAEVNAELGGETIDWLLYADTTRSFGDYEATARFLRGALLSGIAADTIQAAAEQALEEMASKPWPQARKMLESLIAGESQWPDREFAYPIPEMVQVTGGEFWMGDNQGDENERPEHRVQLSDFEIGKYEVTAGQYVTFLNAMALPPDSITAKDWIFPGRQIIYSEDRYVWVNGEEGYPVIEVSWYGAEAYVKWLQGSLKQDFSLPTEAQWEYAAVGGQQGYDGEGKRKFQYAGSDSVEIVAWYNRNSGRTWHPVGMLKANPLGLHDMSGNLFEWCQDSYERDYYGKSPHQNPEGPFSGIAKVVRGGSWDFNDLYTRVADRSDFFPYFRVNVIGFRLCRYSAR